MSTPRRAIARPLTLALIAAFAIAMLPGGSARPVLAAGSISLTTSGTAYTQDFASLASTGTGTTASLPAGWDFVESGTNANTTYTAGTGSSNAGDTYSFGAASSTERALGGLQSGSLIPMFGAAFVNDTGSAIASLDIAYTGEQWRLGALGRTDRIDFQISLDATSLTTGTWTDVDSLDFTAPTTTGTAGPLDGNLAANRTAVSGAIASLSIGPSATFWIRWADLNATGADDGLAVDDFSLTPTVAAGDAAPAVAASTPADGAVNVAVNASLSVTFSEQVVVASGAITLACGGVAKAISVSGDPGTTFDLTYLPPLPGGATCEIAISAAGITDSDTNDPPNTMAANLTIDFTTVAPDPCAAADTAIGAVQGTGDISPLAGSSVVIQGAIVGDYEYGGGPTGNYLRGFYIQDAGDGDAATSDGIFVFNGNANAVDVGDVVQVTGTASEFNGQTQLSAPSVVDCATTGTVTPVDISFPVADAAYLERYEGMLVRVPETMTVTEHFQLGRFGQVVISSEGRLRNPTAVVAPGAPAADLQAANNLRKVIVDDALQSQNPDPIVFGRGGNPLSANNTLRGGDTITNLTGVMTYTWAGNAASGNAYRIRPIGAMSGSAAFVAANPRPDALEVDGGLRVAAMNLLNYFNTFGSTACTQGVGGNATSCRGAGNATEFDRQIPKTVAAILGLDADVVGVNEIENDGYGPTSAIAHLVDQLNLVAGAGTYAFIDVDTETGQLNALGDDAIKVGLIYRPDVVTLVGETAVLDTPEFVLGGDAPPTPPLPQLRSRPSLAQAFETVDGARFIVDVNHLKSKGSPCDAPSDAGDGQGNCNVVRTNAATELVAWLSTDPTGTGDDDVLIMGDLNSYAKEDPITVLTNAGYTNLVESFLGADAYSYVFDGQWGYLDHALGSPSAVDQVAEVAEWHINADEPSVLDYNTDFKSAGQIASLYAPDAFRVSDHDPIVVGLDAASDVPTVDAGGPYLVEELGSVQLAATGSDPTDDAVTYAWDLDGDTTFETSGQTVTFEAGTLQAPQTVTVTVRITDENGQSSTDTATIDVIWDFGGFLPPAAGGSVTVKAGASVPVKFSLAGSQGLAILDGTPTYQRWDCATLAPIGSVATATLGEPLSYDPSRDEYKLVWKTAKGWSGTCATLTVAFDDGQAYELDVRFTK